MSEIKITKSTDAQRRAARNYYEKNKEKCKQNSLNYMRDRYKNDEEYRKKNLERANNRYKKIKLQKEQEANQRLEQIKISFSSLLENGDCLVDPRTLIFSLIYTEK
jgi:ABC-type transport system involved in Fe-S cluster assembly fused permease/ATPase subunit